MSYMLNGMNKSVSWNGNAIKQAWASNALPTQAKSLKGASLKKESMDSPAFTSSRGKRRSGFIQLAGVMLAGVSLVVEGASSSLVAAATVTPDGPVASNESKISHTSPEVPAGWPSRVGGPSSRVTAKGKLELHKDWPWWRGPLRNGQSIDSAGPLHLDPAKDSDWKVPVPGRGHASPIVIGDRVYLLSTNVSEEIQFAIAFDRETGEQVWTSKLNQGGFAKKNHPKNSEATSTLASDGERLFAVLWHHETIWCVGMDLEGQVLWKEKVGPYDPKAHPFGYGPSPIVYGDLVICSYEYDGPSAIVAMDVLTGKEVWRIHRQQETSYSTPMIVPCEGNDYLIMPGGEHVTAYSPKTGEQIWRTPGTTMATCGTAVWHGSNVFASGGFPGGETIAIDIKTGEVQWRNRQKAYEQSMIVAEGCLYNFTDSGVLYCWDCKTGEELWKKRMEGPISSSAILIGQHIYWANELGKTWIFKANREKYEPVAEFQIGNEAFASPAFANGQLFIRSAEGYGDDRQEFLIRYSSK